MWLGSAVYLLCLLTSLTCCGLLVRTFLRSRVRLIGWTACAFACLSVNNLLLVADLMVFPEVDLMLYRDLSLLAAVTVMLVGFIWEVC